MDKTVKFLALDYYVDYEDPISLETHPIKKVAFQRQVLTDDPPSDDDRIHVDSEQLRRIEAAYPGCFYTQEELAALPPAAVDESGVSEINEWEQENSPDEPVAAPVTYESMHPTQLAEVFLSAGLDEDAVVQIVQSNPQLADKVLEADALAYGQNRPGVAEGIAAVLSGSTTPETFSGAASMGDGPGDPPEHPSRGGRKDDWFEFARQVGFDSSPFTTRDDLIAGLEKAGKI